ncbi:MULTISPECIES: hypothetical protein [unclassified Brevundimonas]|uniref:hypothetical protein n=1 Tax=unclassified Brevundimonas TaxID=2622653 RepID=UPI0025BDA9F8|nr:MULTISPECIES: hypothetical protein [unclassified Brevundimonas]
MKSINRIIAAVIASGCSALAVQATAQTRTQDTAPLIIHPPAAGEVTIGEEVSSVMTNPVLRLRTTTMRAAKLDMDTDTPSGFALAKMLPAGTKMFGIHTTSGWAYCAVAESSARWWTTDQFVCFEDADKDGRFESVMRSGAPFMRVPLFVFETGNRIALATPAPYTPIDVNDGPSMDMTIYAFQTKRDYRDGNIYLRAGFRPDEAVGHIPIRGLAARARLTPDGPTRMNLMGLEIEILSTDENGNIRYRILKTPEEGMIYRATMSVSTTYTPILIPG